MGTLVCGFYYPEVFYKKDVLKNFAIFTESSCARVSFEAATLLKKRLWHRGFPVNFARFLRAPFLHYTLDDCFYFTTVAGFILYNYI